jgi:adenylyltransferase/sulfurtransferase
MEKERYSRQQKLFDRDNGLQERLGRSTVFIAGIGGLGGPAAMYLAAAGIGKLLICDPDILQLSNLNRQILFREADLGKSKATGARDHLGRLNSEIVIDSRPETIHAGNVDQLVGNAEVVLDCLDNFTGRMVLNEFALRNRIPLVHAGVTGLNGQISFLNPPRTPCLQCIYPEIPENENPPILGATAGILGAMQAMEAIKFLAGTGTLLGNRMVLFDGSSMTFHESQVERDPNCTVCGSS